MITCDCDYILPTVKGWEEHYDNCKLIWSKERAGDKYPRNEDGTYRIVNEYLLELDCDVLYHLGLDTKSYDLPALFGDVKFICTGGSKERMKQFAAYMAQQLNIEPAGGRLLNLIKHSHRFALYKVGPIISVSHGMGIPSMTILLQEIFKLIHYAKMKNPIVFRIGTSGGLFIPAGSVVITSFAMSGTLEKTYDLPILGEIRKFKSTFDKRLIQEVMSLASADDSFQTVVAGTMGSDDFYRGNAVLRSNLSQARRDGPFCDHTESDKMKFLRTLTERGVRNIEMEATAFGAITREAGVRAGIVCVTLLDRLQGDQVTSTKSQMLEWQNRPMVVVGRYITEYLKNKK